MSMNAFLYTATGCVGSERSLEFSWMLERRLPLMNGMYQRSFISRCAVHSMVFFGALIGFAVLPMAREKRRGHSILWHNRCRKRGFLQEPAKLMCTPGASPAPANKTMERRTTKTFLHCLTQDSGGKPWYVVGYVY